MKRLRKLRVRLVLWTVMIEAVLLLIFSGVFIFVLRNEQNSQIEETLHLSADQLNAVVDVRGDQYIVAPDETAYLRTRGVLAWILSPTGELGGSVGDATQANLPGKLPATDRLANSHLPNGEPVRLFVTTLHEGDRVLGTLVLAAPLRDSQTFIRQILLGLGIAIPIVLALSAAGGLFLASRALAPVAAITHTAEHISAADLSQRLELDLPDDEIGYLARTFDGMLERLDRAFQRERQLTSDVSHELRTPLGMMKTQLSLARSRPRDAAALLQMMADMEGDVDRMTQLVEQMLTLARVEQRGLSDFEPLALDELLQEVVDRFQNKGRERGVTVFLKLPLQVDWHLEGDRERLRIVFANLLDNAVKYTPSGKHVMVSASRYWQTFSIEVTDSGMGIAPEHLPHLFERFYRADSARARATGGFGLGLAISQAIVQAHRGQIEVTSEPGQGTTFTVVLPVNPTAQT
jgi:heavy metal sensor kinase